jgi:uncharacterized repeat protein (TIGR03803 family)
MSIMASAQTLTTLDSFTGGVNGAFPSGTLIQGIDGYLYGTSEGGLGEGEGSGTVFRVTAAGELRTLYAFCTKSGCPDGSSAVGGLVEGPDGSFYGTTNSGGANGRGTVFKITPKGALTTIYNFCSQPSCTDGESPAFGSLLWSNGAFYGTTQQGGTGGTGTIFKISSSGVLTTLHSFCSEQNCTDGGTPSVGLIQGTDGLFYGEADLGGANQQGTLYQISRDGTFKTIYAFCSLSDCADGNEPIAGLVQASDGNFYGTTSGLGGFGSTPYGTVFRITPSGTLTTLHVFDYTDGSWGGTMIQATDGNLYGTTWHGGLFGRGTLFTITLNGTLTTIYNFCSQSSCADGDTPISGLLQETNGKFYGTTELGGANQVCDGFTCGTIFSLSAGLAPFVKAQPTAGKVNSRVSILGNNLSGVIGVSFNGVPAAIQVVSNSLIRTTVPTGATTGRIEVRTTRGTLSSNVPFQVLQ